MPYRPYLDPEADPVYCDAYCNRLVQYVCPTPGQAANPDLWTSRIQANRQGVRDDELLEIDPSAMTHAGRACLAGHLARTGRREESVRRYPNLAGLFDDVPCSGVVASVSASTFHTFSKAPCEAITLVEGLGVVGDAHAGTLVQHRSRVRRDPDQPNLRQVHLLHRELFDEAAARGHHLEPGDLGENVLTDGLDLLGLPTGTVLRLGETAVVRLTGLRNPCAQINDFQPGLLKVVLAKEDGTPMGEPAPPTGTAEARRAVVVRKAGVMAVVEAGGEVRAGDAIVVELPAEPHQPLQPV